VRPLRWCVTGKVVYPSSLRANDAGKGCMEARPDKLYYFKCLKCRGFHLTRFAATATGVHNTEVR